MLRTLVTCTKTVVRPAYSRGFAEILSIPTDSQQSGRRRLEIDAAAAGVVSSKKCFRIWIFLEKLSVFDDVFRLLLTVTLLFHHKMLEPKKIRY